MKKCIERLTPYFAGLYFPLLFAVQTPSELTIWRKMALWMALQILLLGALEFAGRRAKAGRSLVDAAGLWSVLFVQVFLRGLIRPSAIDLSVRIRAGFLLLCVIMVFVMILSACFGGNRPPSVGNNTLKLTLLMLIMPVALMIVGVFNRIFFFIGLGWGLLTLFVMLLRKLTDRNVPETDAPERDPQGSALAVIGRWLSYLALAGVLVLMAFALKQVPRTPKPASEEEIAFYSRYEMDVEALTKTAGTGNVKDAVLHFCEFEKSEEIAGKTWETYAPKGLEAFLPEAKTVVDVGGVAETDTVVIYYLAKDGREVRLTYGIDEKGEAFAQNTVYDAGTDTLYEGHGEIHRMYFKFRNGG